MWLLDRRKSKICHMSWHIAECVNNITEGFCFSHSDTTSYRTKQEQRTVYNSRGVTHGCVLLQGRGAISHVSLDCLKPLSQSHWAHVKNRQAVLKAFWNCFLNWIMDAEKGSFTTALHPSSASSINYEHMCSRWSTFLFLTIFLNAPWSSLGQYQEIVPAPKLPRQGIVCLKVVEPSRLKRS